ncbi:MAG: hypothetical protein RL087_1843 [Pseudomonadota bacterium]
MAQGCGVQIRHKGGAGAYSVCMIAGCVRVLKVCIAAAAVVMAPAAHAADPLFSASQPDKFEGALGLLTTYSPSYPGASDYRLSWRPAGFLRYGRWTVSGAGGFTTHRNDDVERGLEAELLRRPGLRVGLGLRLDNGRSESRSPQLSGMGDIRRTLRPRLAVRWQADGDTQFSAALSGDLLGRVGGITADIGATHQWDFGHGRQLIAGVGLSLADQRYMQAWHGVSAGQSLSSGLQAYSPGAGLRSWGGAITYRHEFGESWASFVSLNYARLAGPALDSPLTLKPGSAWISGGLAWRF